jgi:DNA uptake protein ComE-like DNA-binding protein
MLLLAPALVSSIGGFALPYPTQTTPLAYVVPAPVDKVDINTASMDELLRVPGMTRTWAARIIRYRPYRAKNDLLDRGVMPSQVYDRIKDHIVAHRVKP